jgi:hypothetical protein
MNDEDIEKILLKIIELCNVELQKIHDQKMYEYYASYLDAELLEIWDNEEDDVWDEE